MSEEIAAAFGHPELRALKSAANPFADRILLRDHLVEVEIGAFQVERGLTQRLRFNVAVELRPHEGAASDDVDDILSYDRLTEAIAAELAVERLNLLETLAERIAARILAEPQALRVFLRVEKLDRGPGALGVEIVRDLESVAAMGSQVAAVGGADGPRPIIVWLPGVLPDLAARLDRLATYEGPFVLVLPVPDLPRPRAAHVLAQRQIDLLAIEQAAHATAARDPRLSVVATRTEIDWAMRQGKLIIWAPGKLVLDTPGAPERVEADGYGLAQWLMGQLNGRHLLTLSNNAALDSLAPILPAEADKAPA
ncbi:MAG: dihydroneopterin aldolase [Paracoccaceae bacterium]